MEALTTLDPAAGPPPAPPAARTGERMVFVRRLLQHRGAAIGLVLLLAFAAMAFLAPTLAPHDPNEQEYTAILAAPSGDHLLGTDGLGRDILSRVLYGARISLLVGLVPVAGAFVVGTVLGVMAGFYGRWIDTLVMRLTDIGLAFPGILLALIVVAVLGPGLTNVMIAVGIADIPLALRVARGSALVERERLYVQSAVAIGAPDRRIIGRHVLPAVLPSILVVATLQVAHAILIAAGLSFLGLGAQPPTAEWGSMLAQGRAQLQTAWWVAVFPGIAIVLAVLAINLVGDGIRDALDPKRRPR